MSSNFQYNAYKEQVELSKGQINKLQERVRWLEEQLQGMHVMYAVRLAKSDELEKQNKRYREALKFYANRNNYKLEHFDPNLDDYMSTVDYDEGQKARKALEGEEE